MSHLVALLCLLMHARKASPMPLVITHLVKECVSQAGVLHARMASNLAPLALEESVGLRQCRMHHLQCVESLSLGIWFGGCGAFPSAKG